MLSLVLMFADSRFDYLSRVRFYGAMLVTPVHYIASLPTRFTLFVADSIRTRDELISENQQLKEQLLLQSFKLQKLEHLSAENSRLNDLLNASSFVQERVVRAQLSGESPDPFAKRILINKGSNDEVYVGQPVLDADGLVGQVREVNPMNSWVVLITDPQNGTPVQVIRNGIRAIAIGTRDSLHNLTLTNVPNTSDIRVGDLLETSGLGQNYPVGYPVGVVSSVRVDPGKPFAEVLVTPTARIDRSRNFLLLFHEAEPETDTATQISVTDLPEVTAEVATAEGDLQSAANPAEPDSEQNTGEQPQEAADE